MISTSIPAKFALPWGANANGAFIRSIPTTSQIGIQNGAASLNDGFPPLTFTPETAGGTPPFGQDFNGILNEITKIQQWQQAGGGWVYDSAFATEIGGYPAGAILNSAILPGRQWINLADNNTQNPDVFPFTGWTALPGTTPAGMPIPSFSSTVLPAHALADGRTIGNNASGGTTPPTGVQSPTAYFLFCALWQQFPQTTCPTQFNGANAARGANPNADWVANRVIATPNMMGTGIIAQDNGTSRLTGVPVSIGGVNTAGSLIGENRHSLSAGENGSHAHTADVNDPSHTHAIVSAAFLGGAGQLAGTGSGATITLVNGGSISIGAAVTGISVGIEANGSGSAHNTVQLSWLINWNLAL